MAHGFTNEGQRTSQSVQGAQNRVADVSRPPMTTAHLVDRRQRTIFAPDEGGRKHRLLCYRSNLGLVQMGGGTEGRNTVVR